MFDGSIRVVVLVAWSIPLGWEVRSMSMERFVILVRNVNWEEGAVIFCICCCRLVVVVVVDAGAAAADDMVDDGILSRV